MIPRSLDMALRASPFHPHHHLRLLLLHHHQHHQHHRHDYHLSIASLSACISYGSRHRTGFLLTPSCPRRFATFPSSSSSLDVVTSEKSVNIKKQKQRLDEFCQEKFPQYSRTQIQSWILQGKVLVDGQPLLKAGVRVSSKSAIDIIAEVPKYVCRGGYKLEAAIEHFNCDVVGKVALDAGLSTGGFTDCLLQSGAAYVYGVDVGYGQVAERIRTDKRVHILERTNLRHLSCLPELVDITTLDLSFISILMVMPAVCSLMKLDSMLITLIKPQFEAQRSQLWMLTETCEQITKLGPFQEIENLRVGGGGIVRDPAVHKEVIGKVIAGVESHGFTCQGWIESPLKGAEGNIEFLSCFKRNCLTEVPLLKHDK